MNQSNLIRHIALTTSRHLLFYEASLADEERKGCEQQLHKLTKPTHLVKYFQ